MPAKLVDAYGNPLVTKKPATRHYRPIDTRVATPIRDLPPLSIMIIEAMLREPMIQLCLPMREAPLLKMEIAYLDGKNWVTGVRCDDPAIGDFAHKQLLRIWNYAFCLTEPSQKYGWAGAEVLLELDEDTGLLEVNKLVGRHPRDVRLMLKDGCPSGVQFLRTNTKGGQPVTLDFPRAVFHAHFPKAGEWYGVSILDGAYSPWWDKWMRGGGLDIRRLFMHKDAYGGADMTYPQGEVELPDGSTIKNKDIAREIVEQMQSGAVTTRPYETDEHGNNKWQLTRATVPNNPQHILQYPKDLDDEIRRGMGIPDDVVTSDSTGSWDGKSHSVFSFLGTLDKWGASLLRDIKEQILDQLIEINFGSGHYYEVSHKPFVEQLKAQQGAEGGQGGPGGDFGGGIPGDRPLPGGIGQDSGDDPNQLGDEQDDNPSDRAFKIAMSAIGRGVIEAKEVVRLASDATPKGARWITIGGSQGEDGEHEGGFPIMIGDDGTILRSGGPQGVLGKKIGELKKEHFSKEYKEDEKPKAEAEKKEKPTKNDSRPAPASKFSPVTHRVVAKRFGIPESAVNDILSSDIETLRSRDRHAPKSSGRNDTVGPDEESPRHELGTARIASYSADPNEAYVDFIHEFDPKALATAESEDGIKKTEPFKNYVEWAKQGKEAPPISVFDTNNGTLQSSNRRRTLAAQEAGLEKIKGWYGKTNPETGNPLKYGDIVKAAEQAEKEASQSNGGSKQVSSNPPPPKTLQKDIFGGAAPVKNAPKPMDVPAPARAQNLFNNSGPPGSRNLFAEKGVPDDLVYKPKEKAKSEFEPGSEFDFPASHTSAAFKAKVIDKGNGMVGIKNLASDYQGDTVTVEKKRLPRFIADLRGEVKGSPTSDSSAINEVLSGKAKFLGRGNDGMAFDAGNSVIKVASDVPYHWNNGLRPEGAGNRRLQTQVENNEAMRAAGVPNLLAQTAHEHEGRTFVEMQKLKTGEKLDRSQLDQIANAVNKAHEAGYSIGDDIQVGVDQDGKPYIFDTGASFKLEGRQNPKDDQKEDWHRLSKLYSENGEKYLNPETEKNVSDYDDNLEAAQKSIKRLESGEDIPWIELSRLKHKLRDGWEGMTDDQREIYGDAHDEAIKSLRPQAKKDAPSAAVAGSETARKDQAQKLRDENKAILATPLMSEGNLSPAQLGMMSKEQKAKYQKNVAARMDVESKIKQLEKSDDQLEKESSSKQAAADKSKALQIARRVDDLSRVGVGANGAIRPKYQKEIDAALAEARDIHARNPTAFDDHPELKQRLNDKPGNEPGDEPPPSDGDGGEPKTPKKPKPTSPHEKRWQSTVKSKSEEWGITPAAYQEIADQLWKDKQQDHFDREKAKEYARKLTGLTKGDVERLENQGVDHSSGKFAKIKNLDVHGQSIARSYGLWDADDPNIDHGEKLWQLIKEGKQSIPAKGSPEYVKAVDDFLADQMKDYDFGGDNGGAVEEPEDWLARFSSVTRMSLIRAMKRRRNSAG